MVGALILVLGVRAVPGRFHAQDQVDNGGFAGPGWYGPGSKVTFNGVEIGQVASISEVERDGKPAAKFTWMCRRSISSLIPANVDAEIKATTVFGGKYVSLTTPKNPSPQRITAPT